MKVERVTTKKQLEDAYYVRTEVFVNEQNVPEEEEIDQFEEEADHFVLYDADKPVGAGRCRVVDNMLKVERICVMASHRSKGAGSLIMKACEEVATEKGIKALKLNAQTQAQPFYERLGYECTSTETFLDAGIPHVTMKKAL
ncbi:GNAT family N-acetyltransferase [Bacillus tianshenii]|nr:GNAT family N-acetyltransferase [Bacillus tianshenii]